MMISRGLAEVARDQAGPVHVGRQLLPLYTVTLHDITYYDIVGYKHITCYTNMLYLMLDLTYVYVYVYVGICICICSTEPNASLQHMAGSLDSTASPAATRISLRRSSETI